MRRKLFLWLLPAVAITGTLLVLSGNSGRDRAAGSSLLTYRHPLSEEGSIDAEIAFLEERVKQRPKEGLDLSQLATAYIDMGRRTGDESWYDKAEDAARRSLANLSVSNPGAKISLAKVASARHDFAEAVRLSEDVMAVSPRALEAYSVRATANLALGRLPWALLDADRVADATPFMGALSLRGTILEAMGRDEEALEDWHAALRVEDVGQVAPSSWVRAVIGRWHLRHGDLAAARAWVEESRRLTPTQPIATLALAEIESREGNVAEAERLCNAGFNVTKDPTFLARLGTVRQRAGNASGAAIAWGQAETLLRSENEKGRYGHRIELARVLLSRGGAERAKEALALSAEEVAKRRAAEILGVHAWALVANGDGSAARLVMREALASGARNAELYLRAADAEAAIGNKKRSRFYRDLAKDTDPTLPELSRESVTAPAEQG